MKALPEDTLIDIMSNLRLMDQFREEGLIGEWAVSGAVAGELWGEPRTFQELEVIVSPSSKNSIDEIQARLAGMGEEDEFSKGKVRVSGYTFNIVPTEGIFGDALDAAFIRKFPGGLKVKVVRPEYLLVMFLEPFMRLEFVFAVDFCQYMNLDFRLIERIVRKHGLSGSYKRMDEIYNFKKIRKDAITEIWRTPMQFKHKVKYHRENARQPLYKKVESIDNCCALYLGMMKVKKNMKIKENDP